MDKTIEQIISQNLITLRKNKNLKQSDLSNAIGYSDKTISRWENGTSLPDISTLVKLADFYGISVEDLINENATEKYLEKKEKKNQEEIVNFYSLMGLGILTIWMVAILVYLGFIMAKHLYFWQIFILAVPASAVLVYKNTRKNFKVKWLNFLLLTIVVLGTVSFLYLTFLSFNFWQLFMLVVPLEGISAITSFFPTSRKRLKKQQKEDLGS